jgi:hypothetical protein
MNNGLTDPNIDLRDMARDLWQADHCVSAAQEDIDSAKSRLKEAKKQRDDIVMNIVALGKSFGPSAVPLKRAS